MVKTAGVAPSMLKFTGPAIIFDSQDDACAGILGGQGARPATSWSSATKGPRAARACRRCSRPPRSSWAWGWARRWRLITDGRFSGGTRGACIGHVSPEAAEGGPIGLVKDGDPITIDVEARTIQLELPAAELERRRKGFQPKRKEVKSPWLRRYAYLVTNASSGAVLKSDL